MTISACDAAAPIPEWLLAYHDYLTRSARVDPWPLQSRRPSPQSARAEVAKPLSGAEAQLAIQLRRDTNHQPER